MTPAVDTVDTDTIAWFIPTPGNAPAQRAAQMPQNAHLQITNLPSLPAAASPNTDKTPALRLSFSNPPTSPHGFLLGTDPTCDIVLPSLPGISRRHCLLTFDASSNLVLVDTSKNGTSVWYGHRSCGDRRGSSWVLDGGEGRVVVDIQGVRFQVVVNAPGDGGYLRRVDDFLVGLAERREDVAPVCKGRAGFVKHTVVEEGAAPKTFLWSVARPWDPIIPLRESACEY